METGYNPLEGGGIKGGGCLQAIIGRIIVFEDYELPAFVFSRGSIQLVFRRPDCAVQSSKSKVVGHSYFDINPLRRLSSRGAKRRGDLRFISMQPARSLCFHQRE